MSLPRTIKSLIIAFASSLSIISSADAGLLLNGSFEIFSGGTPVGTPSQLADTPVGGYSTLSDWVVGSGNIGTFGLLMAPATASGAGSFSPRLGNSISFWGPDSGVLNGLTGSPDGGYFVALGTNALLGWPGDGMTQFLSGLTVGAQYDVAFAWAIAQPTSSTGESSAELQANFGSSASRTTATRTNPSTGFSNWQYETFSFTATSANEYLNLRATGSGNNAFVLVDGVTVTAAATSAAVPEPGTMGLLAAVSVSLIVTRLRRRKISTGI